jgi:hypothetical protein
VRTQKRVEIGIDPVGDYPVFRYGIYLGEVRKSPDSGLWAVSKSNQYFKSFTKAVRYLLAN